MKNGRIHDKCLRRPVIQTSGGMLISIIIYIPIKLRYSIRCLPILLFKNTLCLFLNRLIKITTICSAHGPYISCQNNTKIKLMRFQELE